jgi:Ca-activated chloride channel family protein
LPLASLFMFNATAFVLTLALVPPLAGQAANPPAGSEFTLHTTTQLVVLNVGVQDVHGTEIKGLEAKDFKVYEDGHPQVVKQFAAEDRPVTVGIVLDASGSMRTKQAEVVTAALAFVHSSNPNDEVFVVTFNDHASLGLPSNISFSRNAKELGAALLGRKPEGKTALYDALVLAADHLGKGKWENKALLLISDGGDNNSTHTIAEAIQAVQRSWATVYSIALFDPDEPEHNLGALHRLSKMTGGEAFAPTELAEIRPLCVRIAEDLRASYTVAYTPPHSEEHTASRKIKVLVTSPSKGKVTVRTRASYILADR